MLPKIPEFSCEEGNLKWLIKIVTKNKIPVTMVSEWPRVGHRNLSLQKSTISSEFRIDQFLEKNIVLVIA